MSQRSRKLGFKQARELDEMPARIQALEAEQEQLNARLADPTLYNKPSPEVRQLQLRHAAVEEEITVCLRRWEELEAMRDHAGA
jgi:ATP-binding cassette subfamily F protein uup